MEITQAVVVGTYLEMCQVFTVDLPKHTSRLAYVRMVWKFEMNI